MGKLTLFEMLKRWIKIPLFIYVGALVMECLAGGIAILALGGGSPSESGTRALGVSLLLMAGMALVQLAMLLAIAVLFLRLLYKAVQKAQGFTKPFTSVSPGWAVGYWFIPFMNLYRPFQVVKSLFQACSEETGGKPAAGEQLLGAWWAMYLLSNIVAYMVGRQDIDTNTADGVTTFVELNVGSDVLLIAAAWLFWLVVQRLVQAMDHTDAVKTQPATSPA